ncbi:uncharacterized protein MICPUCDRAFT_70947 [Micromonas pusilla CCMP1545]|uniref:cystathionine gamma-lyase n=1 Tax=Micromonas pusilla (strain CCMP1545) TaxID=564608 RepID=C1N9Z8_MICPC|nr:uncharacterized protein MICPUCDRAFT_70947 [Micromonas pusilla CCMP1545]EEH51035.1 predicted protein [Micromonas pusilla CCMP1545]|eukprot:XP_003064701.1 predicted protein [Micromonas pusilla CCMP1545]
MSPPSSPPSSAYSPPISYSPPPRLSPWRGVSVDTILAQAGGDALGLPHAASTLLGDATGSLVPPIFPSTTYARDAETYAPRVLPSQLVYSRPDNPTYARCERVLAALDRGVDAMLFASGMAAVSAVAHATCARGDRLVCPRRCYFAVRAFFQAHCERFGIEFALYDQARSMHWSPYDRVRVVDATAEGDLERVIGEDKKTKLVWVETPANPTWELTDIRRAAEATRKFGAKDAALVCDATALTPVVCRPIEYGADFTLHSATKYLNGHSDVVAGAVVAARESKVWDEMKRQRTMSGAVCSPFDAWLLLRGLRTLHVRVERQCATALRCVLYTANYLYGGMLSIRVKGGKDAALRVVSRLRLWCPATSLGGVESLVEHRYTVEGPDSGVPDDLLRLSCGLEDAADLYEDLRRALDAEADREWVKEKGGGGGKRAKRE